MPSPAPVIVELCQGALRLALRPDLGGAIAGLWLDGLPVLRSTEPAALADVRAAGCYPLVPYSNRIGSRRFDWRGRPYELAANADGPHTLHGVAWQRPWQVLERSDARALLAYTHRSDEHWPFSFHIEQVFELTPSALRITLAASNIDAREMPLGLGWHPYFVRRTRSRIHLELTHRWEADAALLPQRRDTDTSLLPQRRDTDTSLLPQRRVPQPGLDADVAALDLDHCFDGWAGAARIRDEKLSLRLTSSLTHAVVYTPRDRAYFCVEPVSHVNNAVNSDDPTGQGLIALRAGGSAQAWMQLDVARA